MARRINKKTLKKFKNSLEFDFQVTVKLDKKNDFLENIKNHSLEEVARNMIENAIDEYRDSCGDSITACGNGDDEHWVAATYPDIKVDLN
jgi:hypothetical protein